MSLLPVQMRKVPPRRVCLPYGPKIESNHKEYIQHLGVGFCTWKKISNVIGK